MLIEPHRLIFVAESPAPGASRRRKASIFCVLMTITAPPAAAEQRTPAGGWYDLCIDPLKVQCCGG